MQPRLIQTIKISMFLLLAISFATRILVIHSSNLDTTGYIKWYTYIVNNGFTAFKDNFSVYTPPYLYFLWLGTFFQNSISPVIIIKIIPIFFDFLSAFAVYKIVRIQFPKGDVPVLAAAGFLSLPTIIANSSLWGQIDALYTSFILLCIYFVLTERSLPALIMFGISISIKAQGVFLFPFLAVLTLKKRIPPNYYLIPPVIYFLTILPTILTGRPIIDALMIYVSQAAEFPVPSMHAPNLYSLVKRPYYDIAYHGGLILGATLIGSWILFYAWRKFPLSPKMLLFTALISVILVPFVLPKMHDRYFYPADVISYILFFFWPEFWIVPIIYQCISGLVYYIFLFSVTPENNLLILRTAVALNTITICTLLILQFLKTKPGQNQSIVDS